MSESQIYRFGFLRVDVAGHKKALHRKEEQGDWR